MSYSIILFSHLIFHFLEIIWTLKIFNNFSSYAILISHMLELKFFFIFQTVKFYKIVDYSKLVNYYMISWLFEKLTNFPI